MNTWQAWKAKLEGALSFPIQNREKTEGTFLLNMGPFIYYVSTCRGGGGVRKCQFLLILSTKNMLT